MAEIEINNTIPVITNTGEEMKSGVVLAIKIVQYNAPNPKIKVLFNAYLNEDAQVNNGIPLNNVLGIYNNVLELDTAEAVEGFVPLIQKHLEVNYGITDSSNLIVLNTTWHTEDEQDDPIEEVRNIRVYMSWKQAALYARQYPDYIVLMEQLGIPIVYTASGQYLYFEYLDNPMTPDEHPVRDSLLGVGAIIMNK
jgi:hypothetical protein